MAGKKKKTVVNFVLDETGSMGSVRDATISGFNEYIETLKGQGGEVLFTLTKFNSSKVETVYNVKPIQDVPKLTHQTYAPAMNTPLYDAIAQTIRQTEDALKEMKGKPAVLCVIMTDGEENASREFNRERIVKLIEDRTAEGWTFAYLGANQDAWAVGASIGVPKGNSIAYDAAVPVTAFAGAAMATNNYLNNNSAASRSFFADVQDSEGFKLGKDGKLRRIKQ